MPNGEEGQNLPEQIWAQAKQFFLAQGENVWKGFLTIVPDILGAIGTWINGFMRSQPLGTWEALMDDLSAANLIDANDARQLKNFLATVGPGAPVFSIAIYLIVYFRYLSMAQNAITGTLRQNLNQLYTPNVPGPGEVLGAMFRNPEFEEQVDQVMRRNGLSEEDIKLIKISALSLHDEITIRGLFYRGVINDAEADTKLRELGFTDTRIAQMKQLWPIIPPVQDIITMAVREAFDPAIAQRFGQYEDFPSEFGEWTAKQGLSQDWAQRYWAAHWQLPSAQMGFEMLHRGVIEQGDLNLLLKAQDIMPFWRDKVTGISYNPYTRVDVRRMHKMGVLNESDVLKAYKDIGYDDDHARKMTDFTVQYNAQDQKIATKAEIIKAYKQKLLTASETTEMMRVLNISDESITFELALSDWQEMVDIQGDVIKSIETYYVNNLIDQNQALDKLNQLNLSGDKIQALFARWEPKRFIDQKVPSKTDLDKFLKAKIINEDQWRSEMQRLGYAWNYTDWYLALNKKGK